MLLLGSAAKYQYILALGRAYGMKIQFVLVRFCGQLTAIRFVVA